jgi:hypothetical protein
MNPWLKPFVLTEAAYDRASPALKGLILILLFHDYMEFIKLTAVIERSFANRLCIDICSYNLAPVWQSRKAA